MRGNTLVNLYLDSIGTSGMYMTIDAIKEFNVNERKKSVIRCYDYYNSGIVSVHN